MFPRITFFRQMRVDGGVRTGLMMRGDTVAQRFDEGSEDEDPSLIWSVDLRCDGDALPDTAVGAKAWLLEHQALIQAGFREFADDLQAGSDPTGAYKLEWGRFRGVPEGVEMRIFCGAMRRVDALMLGRIVGEVGAS